MATLRTPEEQAETMLQAMPAFSLLTTPQQARMQQQIKKMVQFYAEPTEALYFVETMLHYVTLADMQQMQGDVPANMELRFIQQNYGAVEHKTQDMNSNWIKPEELHHEEILSTPCRYCRQRNVLVQPLQSRSADEPADLFHQCRDCGRTWQVSGRKGGLC
jgi:DNA-directed RNA polymerase subunit M/transcription elongation factor TFIIS